MRLSWRVLWVSACLVFAYPPFSLWPLALVAMPLFLWPLVNESPEFFSLSRSSKFLYFFVTMNLCYWGGFYWIAHTLHEFADLNWVFSVLTTAVICALFSLSFALLGGLGAEVQSRFLGGWGREKKILFWIFLLALWDFFDPKAFPWSPVKALGADRVLLASVGILKTFGWKSLFWIFQAYLLWEIRDAAFFRSSALRYRLLGVTALFLSLGYGLGLFQIHRLKKLYPETQPVVLIQGNVGNYDKKLVYQGVMPTVANVMNIHRDLIEEAAIQLAQKADPVKKEPWILWPETGFPGFPLSDRKIARELADWVQLTRGLHMVGGYESANFEFGGVTEELEFNIVAFFHSRSGYVSHYRKRIRMPFGEFIPGEDWWPSAYKFLPVNHFGRGDDLTLLVHPDPQGPVFIPVICYEVLQSGLLDAFYARAERDYPGRPVILLNPSNDSWYGESSEPFHHSLLARWEAARLALPLLRPTNTGMSQVVAPWGEVLSSGPRNRSTVIYGDLPVKKAVLQGPEPTP